MHPTSFILSGQACDPKNFNFIFQLSLLVGMPSRALGQDDHHPSWYFLMSQGGGGFYLRHILLIWGTINYNRPQLTLKTLAPKYIPVISNRHDFLRRTFFVLKCMKVKKTREIFKLNPLQVVCFHCNSSRTKVHEVMKIILWSMLSDIQIECYLRNSM